MPDAWPKASIIMTPGNIGLFGKCPLKNIHLLNISFVA
jgi:hypothetical protein